jgi:VanZ family protein
MARDATNMPFERNTSYQNNDPTEQVQGSNHTFDTSLKIENMLLEEFNYVSVTAYQAMEDRARISSFYYLLLGVLASGLAAVYQFSGGTRNIPLSLVTILLFIGALISISFFVTLIRLRQAYKESLLTMNVIKEFYIDQFKQQIPAIEQAFRWRLATMPKGERIGSVTFMIAALNAFIGSLCLGAAVFFIAEQPLSEAWASILAGVVFLIAVLVHIYYYRKSLSKESDIKTISKQVNVLEAALNKSAE